MDMKRSAGKDRGLQLISDENNIILATAMDQRGSLRKTIEQFNHNIPYNVGLNKFKEGVSEILGNKSSSLLLDPEYGWNAAKKLNESIGLIMAYEKTGYDTSEKGRLPNLVDDYAVQDLVREGVNALKLLVYYNQYEEEKYNQIKRAFIKRVGDECKQNDLLFILEPLAYSAEGLESDSTDFIKMKPEIVKHFMKEFSKDAYGVDLLKVEVPVALHNIEGYSQFENYAPVFTKEVAASYYLTCSEKSTLPFIYLSGGVSNEQFIETLHFAKKAGARFCGSLCGRAIWKEGIQLFATDGEEALYQWLKTTGVDNLNKVISAIKETATPWS